MRRFRPVKRTALDKKVYWVVYDTVNHNYSHIVYFGKYRTKKECQFAIDKFEKAINETTREYLTNAI